MEILQVAPFLEPPNQRMHLLLKNKYKKKLIKVNLYLSTKKIKNKMEIDKNPFPAQVNIVDLKGNLSLHRLIL